MDIVDFAQANNLEIEVKERPYLEGHEARYFADFTESEIMENGYLVGAYGDGRTIDEAIAAWAERVSLCRIAVRAYKPDRREIQVPRLTYTQKKSHEVQLSPQS